MTDGIIDPATDWSAFEAEVETGLVHALHAFATQGCVFQIALIFDVQLRTTSISFETLSHAAERLGTAFDPAIQCNESVGDWAFVNIARIEHPSLDGKLHIVFTADNYPDEAERAILETTRVHLGVAVRRVIAHSLRTSPVEPVVWIGVNSADEYFDDVICVTVDR